MTAFLERESASDLDLISAARTGDDEAVAELYLRHHDAAARYARGLADPTTAEDLVAEAFAKLLESIRNGGGPSMAFRPYLLRTVHNVYVNHVRRDSRHSWVEDADDLDVAVPDSIDQRRESAVLATAFAALPERWQAVLWHTAVEGEDHDTVGRMLGIKANAVAALAFRSRDGLRRAYLDAHLGAMRDEKCRPFREQLSSYARGRVRGARRQRLEQHLGQCPDCTAGYLELSAIGTDLGALLAPALLGTTATAYAVGTSAGAGGAAVGGGLPGFLRGRSLRTSAAATTAAAAAVAVAVVSLALVVDRGEPEGGTAGPSGGGAATGAPAPGSPATGPKAGPDPSRSPDPVVTSVSPAPSTTTAAATDPAPSATDDPSPRPSATGSPIPPTSSPSGSPSAVPTKSPSATPTTSPSGTPSPPVAPPSPTPTTSPTVDPTTREDLALGSGSFFYSGPHYHLQMSVTAVLDPTVVTLAVRGFESFTLHTGPTYLPADCTSTDAVDDVTELTCRLTPLKQEPDAEPAPATFAIDLVVSGELDVVARVSAANNVDANPDNDELGFHS